MVRQLFFLTLFLGCIWLFLDEIRGKKHIEAFIEGVSGWQMSE